MLRKVTFAFYAIYIVMEISLIVFAIDLPKNVYYDTMIISRSSLVRI